MGLDTTHDAWHGAYSAFTRWRNQIAEVAGYDVERVKYKDGWESSTIMIDWGHLPDGTLMGDWEKTPEDPLLILIAHSDCEGVIHPAQAGPLADRLEELIPLLDEDWGGGHIGNGREKTQAFVDGLRAAVEADEDLEFG